MISQVAILLLLSALVRTAASPSLPPGAREAPLLAAGETNARL